jgi:hypothetical protein
MGKKKIGTGMVDRQKIKNRMPQCLTIRSPKWTMKQREIKVCHISPSLESSFLWP